jgi:putative CocE/NonD family hydrolase
MKTARYTAGLFFTLLISHSPLNAQDNRMQPVVIKTKYNVRIERNVRIPMRDGVSLSADLICPDSDGQFPMIMEYHPYRKDDVSRGGFDAHWYFAERGFIGVRLDARGTGSSEGINTDEYRPIEQRDGFDAIEWLAKQPYSNGNIGMFGTSYGGFTAIQVAMQQPPHLKAIVPIYATDDRYTDDCHYTRGGNMRMYYDVGTYGGSMVGMNAMPPLPELIGPGWAEMWKSRLENNQPYLLSWMKHQVDGEYWRRASLRPEYDRVKCPVFHIAGWHDGYVNAQLRAFVQTKDAPKKILIGPWVHQRGNVSVPGPRIDYLHEVCRFFAHWLRGEDNGIMDEPAVMVYMQEYTTPRRNLDIIPGYWRSEAGFPVASGESFTLYLQEGGKLSGRNEQTHPAHDEQQHLPTIGTSSSFWSAGGMIYYLGDDQRPDEARSLTYTSQPFDRETRILGWPKVILHASSSAKVATFVTKLSDVAPDGHSALIVDGSLNGTRRKSYTDPSPMKPGEIYELDIPMMPTGWIIKPGHRLRLSVASSDFPNLWPTPLKATNRIYFGSDHDSRVILPVIPTGQNVDSKFLPAPQMHSVVKSYSKPPLQQVLRDQITGSVTVIKRSSGTVVLDDNLGQLTRAGHFRCTASAHDPAKASIVGTHTYVLKREDGVFKIVAESSIRATATAFHIVIDLIVTRNGESFFEKQWMTSEPRKLL